MLDSHQHFWRYTPQDYGWISDAMPAIKRDFLPNDLAPLLQATGFEGCIAVQARQSEAETDFLLALAAESTIVKGVVGWVDLQAPNLEERLEHYATFPALKGFRHIVQDEPDDDFLLRTAFMEGVRLLHQYHFTYDILIYEKQMPAAVAFVDRLGEQALVLDHIGKPLINEGPTRCWTDGIRALAQYPHVYCKVSGLVTEATWHRWKPDDFKPFLDIVFEAFGPDRLMVGSDWPVCLLAADSYAAVVELVEDYVAGFSKADRAKIFGGNAEGFYGVASPTELQFGAENV